MHIHIGCHMNNIFAGALSYANDITLLCPSICGINKMIDICCEYAKVYDIKFKTVCIKYVDKVQLFEHVVMNGHTIEWADNVRHLGNFVDIALSDSLDCRYKHSMLIGYVNKWFQRLLPACGGTAQRKIFHLANLSQLIHSGLSSSQ